MTKVKHRKSVRIGLLCVDDKAHVLHGGRLLVFHDQDDESLVQFQVTHTLLTPPPSRSGPGHGSLVVLDEAGQVHSFPFNSPSASAYYDQVVVWMKRP